MLVDVVSIRPLPDHHLEIEFKDGAKGIVNVKKLVKFTGVFEPLVDQDEFEKVRIHEELGVVCWENGADLDSDVLHSIVSGEPLPEFDSVSIAST